MKFRNYLKDKISFSVIYFVMILMIFLLMMAFKIDISLSLVILLILIVTYIIIILLDYFRKKNFYAKLFSNISLLDKSYLVLEMLNEPCFYEGRLLYQALYDINKSMCENVNFYKTSMNDFKEYIEMWIHEVKIPISSLVLMLHNHKNKNDKRILEQVKRIENYVEQVLYYARSEDANKDYLIKETSLAKVIHEVALKNKDDLLEQNINLQVNNVEFKVYTDSKWLEFIINQIINNSIKYKKDDGSSFIRIEAYDEKERITLAIIDNGIGVPLSDIPKVFDKTFTGENGRIKHQSTGMGLFIVKNLCEKLGHQITLESVKDEYTKVNITFNKHKFYDVVK